MKFYSTKTYGNHRGLSCCFRQWKATHSHCSLLHGYSIGIKLTFSCEKLDQRNWVMDFGGLKTFEKWAKDMFDHTVIVATDDPFRSEFQELSKSILRLRVVDNVGCESFAKMCFDEISRILEQEKQLNTTVRVESAEVFEHSANSAIYSR